MEGFRCRMRRGEKRMCVDEGKGGRREGGNRRDERRGGKIGEMRVMEGGR
jgi:hypothetical protein